MSATQLHLLKPGDVAPALPCPPDEEDIMSSWVDNDVPVVSIVCHTFNHEAFIGEAIKGFLMQKTSFAFEIIVNDDASTDGTAKILDSYKKQYPSLIKVVSHKENQFSKGIAPRNFSFPLVRGKYIALCEGDDFWVSPDKLQLQYEAFEPGVSLVFHDAITIEDSWVRAGGYYDNGCQPVQGYTRRDMARGCRIPTASAMFLSSPFIDRNHENVINGDHLMWAIMSGLGRAKFIPMLLSAYRYHEGGVWSARQTVNKLLPVLRSKKTIFSIVDFDYKSAALQGMCGECVGLIKKLNGEGLTVEAREYYWLIFMEAMKMIPRCSFSNKSSLVSLARSVYLLAVNFKFSYLIK